MNKIQKQQKLLKIYSTMHRINLLKIQNLKEKISKYKYSLKALDESFLIEKEKCEKLPNMLVVLYNYKQSIDDKKHALSNKISILKSKIIILDEKIAQNQKMQSILKQLLEKRITCAKKAKNFITEKQNAEQVIQHCINKS